MFCIFFQFVYLPQESINHLISASCPSIPNKLNTKRSASKPKLIDTNRNTSLHSTVQPNASHSVVTPRSKRHNNSRPQSFQHSIGWVEPLHEHNPLSTATGCVSSESPQCRSESTDLTTLNVSAYSVADCAFSSSPAAVINVAPMQSSNDCSSNSVVRPCTTTATTSSTVHPNDVMVNVRPVSDPNNNNPQSKLTERFSAPFRHSSPSRPVSLPPTFTCTSDAHVHLSTIVRSDTCIGTASGSSLVGPKPTSSSSSSTNTTTTTTTTCTCVARCSHVKILVNDITPSSSQELLQQKAGDRTWPMRHTPLLSRSVQNLPVHHATDSSSKDSRRTSECLVHTLRNRRRCWSYTSLTSKR